MPLKKFSLIIMNIFFIYNVIINYRRCIFLACYLNTKKEGELMWLIYVDYIVWNYPRFVMYEQVVVYEFISAPPAW